MGRRGWRRKLLKADLFLPSRFFFFLSIEEEKCFYFVPYPITCNGFKVHFLCEHVRGQGWERIVLPLPFSCPQINTLPAVGQVRKLSQGLHMANTLSMTPQKKTQKLKLKMFAFFFGMCALQGYGVCPKQMKNNAETI